MTGKYDIEEAIEKTIEYRINSRKAQGYEMQWSIEKLNENQKPLNFNYKINWDKEIVELHSINIENNERTTIPIRFDQWSNFITSHVAMDSDCSDIVRNRIPKMVRNRIPKKLRQNDYFTIDEPNKQIVLNINNAKLSIPFKQWITFGFFLQFGPCMRFLTIRVATNGRILPL